MSRSVCPQCVVNAHEGCHGQCVLSVVNAHEGCHGQCVLSVSLMHMKGVTVSVSSMCR